MKYHVMEEEEQRLSTLVASLLAEAEKVDSSEDAQWGKGQQEMSLPAGLERAQGRLARLREAREELEREARQRLEEAERKPSNPEARISPEEREKRKKRRMRARANARSPQRSYNFTDPDARQMYDNGTQRVVTAYNAQLAVDSDSQIIIAADVTQQVNDRQQLVPMAERIVSSVGCTPETLLADAGYWDTLSLRHPALGGMDVLIAPDGGGTATIQRMFRHPLAIEMRKRLQTAGGQALYRCRKLSVEPVIGRIKEHRRFRRFSLRGFANATHEWKLICLTHNLLKLHRQRCLASA